MEHKELNLLTESLGLHSNNNLYGHFVLVEDTVDTSAAFVLHYILKRTFFSHPSSSVIFLAPSNPFSHYDRILRKIGCNLAAQRDNNRLFFIDLLMLQFPGEKFSVLFIKLREKTVSANAVTLRLSPQL
ncbi:hypothetical protein KIW84_034824 [Lathyrus oleraceus]|uniref:Elongator complex protein 6 n=1 Tax=Pisum sativum TaxID=3888 RepID=A0A9D4Y219_PEA|nr:hypothetical protein KIW84_034824 [Pisum sativum]